MLTVPASVAISGTVIISGINGTKTGSSFNGTYQVSQVIDPFSFTYAQFGLNDDIESNTSTGSSGAGLGTVQYGTPYFSFSTSTTVAGAAINPATPAGMLSEVLDKVDTVLVMTVNPGFGGQKFIPNTYEKIRQLNQMRARYNASFRIEVDGGVEPENTAELAQAGANTFVAGTSIFHTADPAAATRQLKKLATQALSQRA